MRLPKVSLTAAISVVAGLTTATAGLTGSAAAADGTTALPLSHYAHMVVDAAHQHLFFSQGTGTTGILVTDLAGAPVTTIEGEQGADGLALSADGRTLYAALTDGDAVSAVDTSTLTESTRFATGSGSAPVSVAVAAGQVWYGYSADGKGAIGSVDPSAGDPAATPRPDMSHWSHAPRFTTAGGVLAADENLSSMVHVATYDLSSGTPVPMTDMALGGGATGPLRLTADGRSVLVPQGAAVYAFRTSDLSPAGHPAYFTGGVDSDPDAVAVDTDGTIALAARSGTGAGVYTYAESGRYAENHRVLDSGIVAQDGLAWGGDGLTLYAVTEDHGTYGLAVLDGTKLTDTELSLNQPSRQAVPTQQFTFTGTVGGDGPLPAGAPLKVTRDGTGLPDAKIGADGSFGVSDTLQDEGTYTYQVEYAGDATHRPATASLTIGVSRLATSIEHPGYGSAKPHAVTFTGVMTTDLTRGGFPEGAKLQVSRIVDGTQEATQLPPVPVDPATGTYSVQDDPGVSGMVTYRLSYAGDTTHLPTESDEALTVSPYTPALTLKAPATATRDKDLSFTGKLGDGPYRSGETVTVTRTDAAHTTTPAKWTAPVATDGTITVKDKPSVGGADTYTVAYAGDAEHEAATASALVQVSRTATTVSVTTNASTYAYGATATVTAHLGTTYNGRTVSVYAQPAGGAKTLVKTGTVDSKGNFSAPYKLTRNTTFTASFAGDYRYAPASATRAVTGQAKVTQTLSGYYTSTTYSGTTYRVYHHTVKPVVTATVAPAKSGQCTHFQLQQYYSGAWHTLTTSSCITLDAKSAAAARLTLTNAVNQKFRVRTEYEHSTKDTSNPSTWSGWLYFTVRT
ncbi:hypothetical protein [Streptomyces sp. NPDC005573]|uniref:hypothetical protein n=1 Tax=Streptomyces sp. NPDC005573 TaxID=3156890 RepID=UPI0033B5E347